MGQIISQYNKNHLVSKTSISREKDYILRPKGLYFASGKEYRRYIGPRMEAIGKKFEEVTIKEINPK